jgi:hypothetical protein
MRLGEIETWSLTAFGGIDRQVLLTEIGYAAPAHPFSGVGVGAFTSASSAARVFNI